MTWKCLNPECGKTFEVLGRLTTEKKPNVIGGSFCAEIIRIIIEQPCCPRCQSIEFELVPEHPKERLP